MEVTSHVAENELEPDLPILTYESRFPSVESGSSAYTDFQHGAASGSEAGGLMGSPAVL